MFVDASAIVAVITEEEEAVRVSDALLEARVKITSPVAVLEMALALARPDKLNRPLEVVEPLVQAFLEIYKVAVRDLPPAAETTRLTLFAAQNFRSGRRGLNLADCLHYACAKHYRMPILATANEFRQTDLEVVD